MAFQEVPEELDQVTTAVFSVRAEQSLLKTLAWSSKALKSWMDWRQSRLDAHSCWTWYASSTWPIPNFWGTLLKCLKRFSWNWTFKRWLFHLIALTFWILNLVLKLPTNLSLTVYVVLYIYLTLSLKIFEKTSTSDPHSIPRLTVLEQCFQINVLKNYLCLWFYFKLKYCQMLGWIQ